MQVALPRGCTFAEGDWRILSRYWHPVAALSDIGAERPYPATLLDEKLILYRDSAGQLVAARNLCVHRGTPLTAGWLEGGEVVCAYHGYRYGAQGRCTLVPAHPGAPIPGKLTLRTYPCREAYGLAWVCLAGDTAEELPAFPEFGDPAFQIIPLPPMLWQAAAGRQVESFCDVAHFAWLHTNSFARREDAEVPSYEVTGAARGLHAEYCATVGNQPLLGGALSSERWRRVYTVTLPFTAHLTIHFPTGGKLSILNAPCPESARRTRLFALVARDFDRAAPISETIQFQTQVYDEDRVIVEQQCPEDLPIDLHEEVHVRADRTSVEYRRKLAALGMSGQYTA
jgi:vanillate O-demethylase monooxygenase subunit